MLKRCVLLLSLLAAALGVLAGDSIEVSVLTCEPGEAVYELYGHTAIRVKDLQSGGRDAVFNYGVFDFNAPNFVWRFVLGETDYEVAAISYYYIEQEYMRAGRRVWQQTLRLDSLQRAEIARLLWVNSLPENRRYRYNYLYDNCTTRCRDMIEAVADVAWPEAEKKTYRQIIHEFAGQPLHRWNALGPDLLLGWAVDTLVGVREQMFSPVYFMRALDQATTPGGRLADSLQLIINPAAPDCIGHIDAMPEFPVPDAAPIKPITAIALWLVAAVLLWLPLKKPSRWQKAGRVVWYVFTFVVVLALAAVIDTLYFFSSHPAVDTNNLVFVFNPLAVLLVVLPFIKRQKGRG